MTGEFKSEETVSKRYADVRLFLSALPRPKWLSHSFWNVQTEILIGSCQSHRSSSNFLIFRIYSYLGGLSNIWLSGPQFQVVREWTARRRPEGYDCSRKSQLATLPIQNCALSSSSFRQDL